jgi:ribonuclease D
VNDTPVREQAEYEWVETDGRLAQLCGEWVNYDSLAIDTEFMRTNTFYAKLGLLQVGDGNSVYLIDPLAITDWAPFRNLCENDSVEFVFHSCSEDLSVFLSHFGFLPSKLFDTQLAAAFLGLGGSLSYAALVLELLQLEVAKDATRSDWLQRPLTATQLNYAALDVEHLLPVRALLGAQLDAGNLSDWCHQECEELIATALATESEAAWTSLYAGVSNAWRLDAFGATVLQALCVWREGAARRRNKPRSWIVKDADLYEFAAAAAAENRREGELCLPLTDAALARVDAGFLKRNRNALDDIVAQVVENNQARAQIPAGPLDARQRAQLKKLQHCVEEVASSAGIGPEVLARKRHLLGFVQGQEVTVNDAHWPQELGGWKKHLLQAPFAKVLGAVS